LKQNIPKKPNCSNVNPELSSKCARFIEINDGHFDGFIELKSNILGIYEEDILNG
jgi:hypothetical protein